ncbi:MAG: radical SAM protein [Deltaproteobacteria bacterium]|nr:radical SAM protein [Deltaproteobacteria bacterium]
MKVLLISANTEHLNIPPIAIGLGCVAEAARRSGHDVIMTDLLVQDNYHQVIKEAIKGFKPEVIGISVRNIDDQIREQTRFLLAYVKNVIAACKKFSSAPIVLGGAGYSIFPQKTLIYLGAEMGIQGEGEQAFPILLIKDLDNILLPEPDAWPVSVLKNRQIPVPVQTRRGCPMKCSYCSTPAIEGILIRKRSPELVAKWIARWVDAGCSQFFFVDNTFNLPSSYAEALCDQLISLKLDIKWDCILYPKNVDEKLVSLMARAGCKSVSLGFESGSETILNIMNKNFTPDDIRETSHLLAKNGIRQMGFLLLGGPGETRKTVQQSFDFVDAMKPDSLKVTVGIRIYPDTPLSKYAAEKGVIAPDDDLLFPTFYLEKELEDWLPRKVTKFMAKRPWVET